MGNINNRLNNKTGAKILALLFVLCFSKSWGQTTIFSENMGTTLSGNPAPGLYTGFQNYGTLTFSGTGDLRNTSSSSGYAGASGSNCVMINAVNETFQISNINSSACSSMTLSFGIYKANNAETGTNLVIEVSTDGITYTALSMPALPSGSNGWYLRTITTGIPSAANLRIRFTALNSTPQFRIDDVILTGNCGGSTSITTGFVNSPPFALTDCTVTASGSVDFTSNGTFNAGNIYTAQLSNSSGSFVSAVNIGTLSSVANSANIPITIPATTASGTGYLIRVISNNPSTIGSNSAAFTITLTCAGTSTCSSSGAMGSNQTSFGCGNNAACNLASIYSAFGTFCGNVDNTSCSSSCITAAVTATYSLPSGCTAAVTAEYKARGSAGACGNSAMDGGDQLYITNSGGTVNSQSASLTSCAAFTSTNTSSISSGCGNGDGIVSMNITGGQITIGGVVDRGDEIITYTISFSGSCGLNCPTLLPISLLDFFGIENGSYNDIIWKVANEEKIENYVIEKSEDGINFRELTIQHAKGNGSGNILNYYIQDNDPSEGITYYRLSTIEGAGNWNVKQIKTISIDRSKNDWKSQIFQQDESLILEFKNSVPKNSTVSLFDLSGKLLVEEAVKDSQTKINVQNFAEGLYFIKIQSPYKTENFKIIIQK